MPRPPSEPPDRNASQPTDSVNNPKGRVSAAAHVSKQQSVFNQTLRVRQSLAAHHGKVADDRLLKAFNQFGIIPPRKVPLATTCNGKILHKVDQEKQRAYSELVRSSNMTLPEFVRLLRGETNADPRPNKALEQPEDTKEWSSYPHIAKWQDIINHGVIPQWTKPLPRQSAPPRNHKSTNRALNCVIKNIRKGQESNQYLVLDIGLFYQLEGIYCSPFGAVQKGDASLTDDARIIHDLSSPGPGSVNDCTATSGDVEVHYDGPQALAQRIIESEQSHPGKTQMMSGDVSGAYRHIPINADHVGCFAGTLPELGILIVDLSCPFGWTNSPVSYWIAGGAINHLHSQRRPRWTDQPQHGMACFDGKVWSDDHNCIEPRIGTRLEEANLSIHRAMVDVLGPTACNEDKFTQWSQQAKALGLEWDIPKLQVSMPAEKILKARARLEAVQKASRLTRTQLNKILGTLRHVITCIPAAKAFIQRLSSLQRNTPKFGTVAPDAPALEDVRWLLLILRFGQLNGIPLRRFTKQQNPTIRLFMDASDQGLCVLFPARREYLQVRFDAEELASIKHAKENGATDLGINTRELMSVVYASLVWGHHWTSNNAALTTHVICMIDNTSAIAWNNKRSSRNPFAQLVLRILALAEVAHKFYVTAEHIPGKDNHAADAGSRVWESASHASLFSHICLEWSQVAVPAHFRKLSTLWEQCSGPEHWLQVPA